MNQGMICGIVNDSITGRAVTGALVAINYIRGMSERGGILRITDPNGSSNVYTVTDERGVFVLTFQWDALDVAGVVSIPPVCHFNIGKPHSTGFHMSRVHRTLTRAISLGRVSGGTIPDPSSLSDCVGMAMDVYTAVRGIRLPMFGRTFMGPSADSLCLLGYFRFNI